MHTPPDLALVVTIAVIVWLFRRDFRQKPDVTRALWIPFAWMLIIMTRFVSSWLDLCGLDVGGVSVEEGSPVDALGSLVLIVLGARVLIRRRFDFSEVMRRNQWLVIFFIWCFLAVFWSDFPFVALKRWIKFAGEPLMVLILFTEPDFETALIVLFKRLTYIIVPVSILFIKYFPDLGRGFSVWNGMPENMGITPGKNHLGMDCLILGFFFVWYTLKVQKLEKGRPRRRELIFCGSFLFLIGWLFNQAQSSTALVSCLVGVALLLGLGLPVVRRENIGTYILVVVAMLGLAEYFFNISDMFFAMLGKDSTMTDRTTVWQDCLSIPINPVIGAGFDSFWLGDRQKMMDEDWKTWEPNEAHNGYLETYLNLGLIGLFILIALLLATFWKSRRELLDNFHFGRFRVAFFVAVVIYNWTEAGYKALHPMWFLFYIISLDYPKPETEPVPDHPAEVVTEPLALEPPLVPGLLAGDKGKNEAGWEFNLPEQEIISQADNPPAHGDSRPA